MSSQFHQEFPSLQAAGEGEKGEGQEEEPYGPGPSLRPQSRHSAALRSAFTWLLAARPVSNCGLSVPADVGSWREGGGRNLNTAPSPPEMDSRAPEEGGTGLGTSTPPGEAEEPGRSGTTEKRDGRERVPPAGPSQPKLNGGQQPPMPTHFDPAFRSMMPPYVSLSRCDPGNLWSVLSRLDPVLLLLLRCSTPTLR